MQLREFGPTLFDSYGTPSCRLRLFQNPWSFDLICAEASIYQPMGHIHSRGHGRRTPLYSCFVDAGFCELNCMVEEKAQSVASPSICRMSPHMHVLETALIKKTRGEFPDKLRSNSLMPRLTPSFLRDRKPCMYGLSLTSTPITVNGLFIIQPLSPAF